MSKSCLPQRKFMIGDGSLIPISGGDNLLTPGYPWKRLSKCIDLEIEDLHWSRGWSTGPMDQVATMCQLSIHCSAFRSIAARASALCRRVIGRKTICHREKIKVLKTESSACVRCIVYCVPRVLTLWTQYVWTGHRHVLVKQAGYIGSSLFSMKTAQN